MARERILALHDLEQRCLLAEEVVVGSVDDGNVDTVAEAGVGELVRGSLHGSDLGGVASLGRDHHVRRPEGSRGDQCAFEDEVGIAAQQGTVLEGAGLALGGVDHDERVVGGVGAVPKAPPLDAGGEAGAATAADAGCGDLVDDAVGSQPSGGVEPSCAPGGDEVGHRGDGLGGQGVRCVGHHHSNLTGRFLTYNLK
jgi:hypothetical protein